MRVCITTLLSSFLFSGQLFSQAVLSARSIGSTLASGGDIYTLGSTIDASGNIYLVGWFRAAVDMDPGPGVSHLISNGSEDCFLAKYSSSGGFLWAHSFGAANQDICRAVEVAPNGEVVITGNFQNSADFDPGPGVRRLTSNGYSDIFFAKFSSTGDLIFAHSIGGTTNDNPYGLALDASGNIFLTGTLTSATVDFDPGPGVSTLSKIGTVDTWVARYDNNGNHIWSFNIGAAGSTQVNAYRMILSPDGNLAITGYFTGGPIDFNPGAGSNTLTSKGISDIFVARYNLSGAYVSGFSVGGTGTDLSYGIAADATGNIYIAGQFEDVVDFNPGTAVNNLTSKGLADIFLAKYTAAGDYVYAKGIGSATGNEVANTLIVDGAGNPVITGNFAGTVDFDPGTPVVNLISNNGSVDVFVVKFTSAGAFSWAKSFGGIYNDQVYTLAKDASNNINIAGYFQNTVDFDPGAGTVNLTAPGSLGVSYSLKLSSTGNYVSVFTPQAYLQTPASQVLGATWIDADNNYYVTGGFGKTVDFDPGPGEASLTAISYQDFFIAKYNAAGELVFVKSLGNAQGGLIGNGIVTDAAGNIYIAGKFQATLDIDPGPAVLNYSSKGGYDIFLLKLSSTGNYLGSAQIGGTGSDAVSNLVIDNAGALYITGQFFATVDFDPGAANNSLISKGNGDAFVAKYNSNLGYVFAVQFGGTGNDIGNDIAFDNAGNLYTVGNFNGTADFDPGANTYNLLSAGNTDAFLSKIDKNGNFVYAMRLGSSLADVANAVAVDGTGNTYMGGMFNGTVDFDPGAGVTELTSAGSGDIYLAKFDVNGNFLGARSYGGTGNDIGQKLKLDSKGNVYLAGQYGSAQLSFDLKGTPVTFNNEGDMDVFLAVINPSLNYLAGRTVGGAQADILGALSLDATGNIYMGGSFGSSATIDNLTGTGSYSFSSVNTRDIFLAKFAVPEILPVTLEKFTAVLQQAEVMIAWTVFAQLNNRQFEIERSVDGKIFKVIGTVAGCSNCPERIAYQFMDKQPLTGVSFYRLKQTDLDGNYTYSRIVRVSNYDNKGQMKLIPTTTTGDVTLSYLNKTNKEQPAVMRLISSGGQILRSTPVVLKPGANNIPMTLMNQAPGVYYVSLLITASGSVQTASVIRQ
ncbi:MAG: SBBP repeat-containing protein [Chitinophagaceae bacterium]|nr:SBBP repeat-containing protein [Chitinophagaceae bacterium]